MKRSVLSTSIDSTRSADKFHCAVNETKKLLRMLHIAVAASRVGHSVQYVVWFHSTGAHQVLGSGCISFFRVCHIVAVVVLLARRCAFDEYVVSILLTCPLTQSTVSI